MKVGVVSLYYNNHNIGGLLQAYAVIALLNEFGIEAEQICYDLSVSNSQSKAYQNARRKQLLLSSGVQIILNKMKGVIRRFAKSTSVSPDILNEQKRVFEEFENSIPHSDSVYNINTINATNHFYDAFVVGSDQVWNLGLLAHDAMYLTFADCSKKRITYAVSMGKASITDYEKEIFLSKIKDFSEVAVREQSLGHLISSISNKKCISVLDPTLLLRYEQWKKIENTTIIPKEKYIFCYFLGDCKWQRIKVQQYAEQNNLSIIDIPYITGTVRKSDRYLKGSKRYDVGPREFIALVKNAQCVFTDSFHAIAFSVNFNTDFYVFDRDGLSGSKSINSRITDFLEFLSLTNRRIVSSNDIISNEIIDWVSVSQILDKKRTESKQWLQHQLLN